MGSKRFATSRMLRISLGSSNLMTCSHKSSSSLPSTPVLDSLYSSRRSIWACRSDGRQADVSKVRCGWRTFGNHT